MKTIREYLKLVSLFLIYLITLQSCSVYHSKTASLDEAIRSDNKVKVITSSDEIYKLQKLQKENDQIYGVIKKGSSTAERLYDQGIIKDNKSKYVNLLLPKNTIKEIHLKNKSLSTVLTIAIPVVGLAALLGIAYSTVDSGISINLN